MLVSDTGLLFTDFESSCVGPPEFDVADAPEQIAPHYPGLDHDLLGACRLLWEALVCTWCWAGHDDHPTLERAAHSLLAGLRTAATDGRIGR